MTETLTTLTAEGLTTVFGMGFMLTVAGWALGYKLALAIGLIKKL